MRMENDQLRRQATPPHEASNSEAHATGSMIDSSALTEPHQAAPTAITSATSFVDGRPTVAATDYRNAGQETPIDALQSYAWACDQADAALMEQLIVFDPAARVKAAAYHASLPPEIKGQWDSLEAMAAALLISEGMRFPNPVAVIIQLALIEPLSSNRVVLRMPGTHLERSEFQQTSAGWKYVITEKSVDDYLAEVSPPPAPTTDGDG